MRNSKTHIFIFFFSLALGIVGYALSEKTEARASRSHYHKAQKIILRNSNGYVGGMFANASDETGFWLNPNDSTGKKRGTIQAGVHSNGYPFFLVSNQSITDFGLGRVDGRNASPIMVFRSKDEVKMVLGLHMTNPTQDPFFTYYPTRSPQVDYLGEYCKSPSRVCTQ